jgi:hypothetical protein
MRQALLEHEVSTESAQRLVETMREAFERPRSTKTRSLALSRR